MSDASASVQPLLQLRGIGRKHLVDGTPLTVLEAVNIDVAAGEMIALVGTSGSGKSTLLHLLGCLDQPTSGAYWIAGQSVGELNPEELAELRRKHFGFVFQNYHLLSNLNAIGNVETPAIYAGSPKQARRRRAQALLERMGLQARLSHLPSQLSGGQQQRVSVARALMNNGQVILADEPTGSLDSRTGKELIALLAELNAQGHTVIIATHDMHVAQCAQRIIEIKDGRIVGDRPNVAAVATQEAREGTASRAPEALCQAVPCNSAWAALDRLRDAVQLSIRSAVTHRLRTFLTMLGIIIGIASVVCVVALGEGSKRRILANMSQFGTGIVDIYAGSLAGDPRFDKRSTLSVGDVEALRAQNYVVSVTPVLTVNGSLQYREVFAQATVNGVDAQFFSVYGMKMDEGIAFDRSSVTAQAQEAVIDRRTREALFPGRVAIGEVILIGNIPYRVIGVAAPVLQEMSNGRLNVWIPYTSAMTRMTGQFDMGRIALRITDAVPVEEAVSSISALLSFRHGHPGFTIFSSDVMRALISQTDDSIRILMSTISAISLLVGGIGVMNIMLVSVAERTHEIGVRMAVGARQADIRNQFLAEAIMICLAGGILGIALALVVGTVFAQPDDKVAAVFSNRGNSLEMVFSTASMLAAFGSATLVGVVFGFVPARRAARMRPVDALTRQ